MPATSETGLELLVERLAIEEPVLGLYDVPDPAPFAPVVHPGAAGHACVWAFYEQWRRGRTVHLTADRYGCRGLGRALFGLPVDDREAFLSFLADDEGLKASTELMDRWLDAHPPYVPRNANLMLGPLRQEQADHLLTATFLVDPDQLSSLIIGGHYHASPDDPTPVLVDFGSGCMELVDPFRDLAVPQAALGMTDIAMRRYVPSHLLAFTVTPAMLRRLSSLDERSFLCRPFLSDLQKARRRRHGVDRGVEDRE